MIPTPPALAYRRAATQQASVVGLVIALYDTLAGDMQRAITAMQRNDIEDRCEQLRHGFSVLTQLEILIDMDHGGQTAINLRKFYRHLRNEMMTAQFTQNPDLLDRAVKLLLDIRSTWQEVDLRTTISSDTQELSTPYAALSCLA